MLRVKSDKCDWFWSQSIVFTNPFKTGMSLDWARGRDSWCWPEGARPLGTRMDHHSLWELCRVSCSYKAVMRKLRDQSIEIKCTLLCVRTVLKYLCWNFVQHIFIKFSSLLIRYWNERTTRGIEKQRAREFPHNGGEGERCACLCLPCVAGVFRKARDRNETSNGCRK